MKTITSTTALRILLLLAAILPFTKANAYDFEVGKLQYSITSISTVTVTGTNSNDYSIEIPNHVTFNNIEYTVTAIGDSAFYNTYISDAIIPETITSIGVAAFKKCNLSNLTLEAMIPPEMHDSFDQHEKPTSFIIDETYGCQNILVLSVYKEAYPYYKNLNDQHHFFSLISCIDGEATEAPYLEKDFKYCPYTGKPYSCTITIQGEEDSYIFVRHNDLQQEGCGSFYNNVFYCVYCYICRSTEYYLEARAISEGKKQSEVEMTGGYLRAPWLENFSFIDSNICYFTDQNEAKVTAYTYRDPCDGYVSHNLYGGDLEIPETVSYNNTIYPVTTICDRAFNNSILENITISNSVTTIGESAFSKSYLKSISIPNSVTVIGDSAFSNCSDLESITIPNSITCIFPNTFHGCTGLTKVNITDLESWCNIDFMRCPDGFYSSNPLHYAHHLYLNGTEVKDLVFPDSITSIGIFAFDSCSGLTSINTGNSIRHINPSAFQYCCGLINAIIGNSVGDIDYCAFYGCTELTFLTIGNNVSLINGNAFEGCPNITIIKCLGITPAEAWDANIFDDCVYQNAILYVPMDAVEAYKNAEGWKLFQHIVGFYDYDYEVDGVYYMKTSDNEVTVVQGDNPYQGVVSIPETVTYEGVTYNVTGISSGAFADATLQSLILPVSIANVEDGAFDGCHINSLIITGNGAWTAGAIAGEIDNLYVMSTVTGIEGLQVNPTTIYSYSTVPPTCNDNTFTGYDGTLHVPASSLAAYFTAPYWSNFINITGDAVEPTRITFNNDSVEVLVGNQLSLNATITPSNAVPRDVIWTTSDESIATVNDGAITALKAGECDIKAYLLDKTATCHVTVTEITPTEVTLNQEFAKLEIGSQLTLTATVLPDNATDKQVTWSTTNSAVATVDSLGHVTAVGDGECFITATCRDKQAMCHVIVVDHFIYITLDEHDVRLMPNHMMTLTPTVSPANTTLVVTSSDPTVAAARMANGNIQLVGIKEGSTVITVNSTDGYAEADSCLIKVYTLRGDVNSDGFINISDVTTLINRLFSGTTPAISEENADANNDGKITIADVTALISSLLSGEPLPPKDEPIEGVETFTVNGVTFTMVAVEGGTFTMGATPEQGTNDPWTVEYPTHEVTLSSFSIGETEVTQALWQAVMGSNPSNFTGDLSRPVEMVSWDDCLDFIARLNQMTGKTFRLPTEAEWEYAARGGNKTLTYKYAGSNDIDEVAWWDTNSCDGVGPDSPDYGTHPVALKKANELGLYDMSGNVWEWCQDWFGNYSSEPQTNPTGPSSGDNRVYRGGSWINYAKNCRVSSRFHWAIDGANNIGLRLVL